VSRALWQQYPRWHVLLYAPWLTQFWLGKMLFEYLQTKYVTFEGKVITKLADLESALTEPNLKVSS
jgi:hypothetical protein